ECARGLVRGCRMRIGIIAPPWVAVPPAAYGGTEEFIDELARGLHQLGHDVRLFCTGDSAATVAREWVFDRAQSEHIGDTALERRHVDAAYEAFADVDVVHDNTIAGPQRALDFPRLACCRDPSRTLRRPRAPDVRSRRRPSRHRRD